MENFYLCNSAAIESALSRSAFKVYSFLSMAANSKTRGSYYKKANIAIRCQVSESTVVRAVRELRKKGLLEIQWRFKPNGRQTSNLYILLDNQQQRIEPQKQDSTPKDDNSNTRNPNDTFSKLQLFKCSPSAFQSGLSANAIKTYSYLSFRAGKEGQTFPAKREIAHDCKISLSTVSRCIKALKGAKLLEIVSQTRIETYGNNGTSVNRYILMSPQPELHKKSDDACSHSHTPLSDSFRQCRKTLLAAISRAAKSSSSVSCKLPPLQSDAKMRRFFSVQRLKTFFEQWMTPSPISSLTPQRTKPKRKIKQRKKYFCFILPKRKILHLYSKWIR